MSNGYAFLEFPKLFTAKATQREHNLCHASSRAQHTTRPKKKCNVATLSAIHYYTDCNGRYAELRKGCFEGVWSINISYELVYFGAISVRQYKLKNVILR
jgi:hypothetical protein